MDTSEVLTAIREPQRRYARADVLGDADPVPRLPGVYGWYFSGLDHVVPVEGCRARQGRRLLYVGIAPSRAGSAATLRSRTRQHLRGNASGSTLRRTLGSLVADDIGIQMRRVGKSERTHFAAGEAVLSEWMDEHARVCWAVTAEPWEVEATVVASLDPPSTCNTTSRIRSVRSCSSDGPRRLLEPGNCLSLVPRERIGARLDRVPAERRLGP